MRLVFSTPAISAVILILLSVGRGAMAAEVEAFYGVYAGRGVADTAGELTDRDLSVEIRPPDEGEGFVVAWSTVSRRPDGTANRKNYRIRFVPTKRESLYSSAMRVNMFGRAIPLDPLNGDPYVWAVISGKTLTVHALVVTDDFGYEMQVYERTVTKSGLDLKFSRVRNGERFRDVTAKLVRLPR